MHELKSMIKSMAANDALPSFVPADWESKDDNFVFTSEDLSGLFDSVDEEFSESRDAEKTGSTEASYQASTPKNFHDYSSQVLNQSNYSVMPAPPAAPPLQPMINAPGQPFVNVYMIVDPASQQVYCPQQVIVYNSGEKIQTAVFGPTVLEDFPKEIKQQTTEPASRAPTPCAPTTTHMVQETPSPTNVTQVPLSFPDGVTSVLDASTACHQQVTQAPQVPLRALSAYNFFFRDERERILNGGPMELTPAKQHKLLQDHWCRDRTKKRRHRKTHGKVDFTTLSKMVSQGWKSLTPHRKAFYREVAARDWERYQGELEQQKNAVIAANSAAVSASNDIGVPSFQSAIA